MAHPKVELVRQRYGNACGYCGVTESSVGGELTIDHYQPLSVGGGESIENLVYSCVKCNQFKGDFWPDEGDLVQNRRVLHPFLDDLSAHIMPISPLMSRQVTWIQFPKQDIFI
jgi:hypothetical protein